MPSAKLLHFAYRERQTHEWGPPISSGKYNLNSRLANDCTIKEKALLRPTVMLRKRILRLFHSLKAVTCSSVLQQIKNVDMEGVRGDKNGETRGRLSPSRLWTDDFMPCILSGAPVVVGVPKLCDGMRRRHITATPCLLQKS